jgi:hypothetical protein
LSGNAFARLRRSAHGNAKVAAVTPSGPHRPSRCRDGDCPRLLCAGYRDGYADAWDDARIEIDAAYRRGYAAGAAAAGE